MTSDSLPEEDGAALAQWYMRAVSENKGLIGVSCPKCLLTVPEEGSEREDDCHCGDKVTIQETAEALGLPTDWFKNEQTTKSLQGSIIK